MTSRTSQRVRVLAALKVAVSVALLAWLGWSIATREGIDSLLARATHVDLTWLGAAIGAQAMAIGAGVVRWRRLLRSQGVEVAFGWATRVFFVGRFVGAFTPSTAGLDVYRTWAAARATGETAKCTTAIVLEKFYGLIGLAFVTFALAPFGVTRMLGPAALWISALTAAGSIAGLFFVARPSLAAPWVAKVPKLGGKLAPALRALDSRQLGVRDTAFVLGLGVLGHLATSAVFVATGRALFDTVSLGELMVVGNAIVIATLLPISVGGVGVREGVAVVLLSRVGIGMTDGALVALLGWLVAQLFAAAGGVAMWTSGDRAMPERGKSG